MPVSHYLKIFNTSGTNPLIVTQTPTGGDTTKGPFADLVYSNVVNGYGICKFTLNGNHLALSNLTPGALVEVWRSWPERSITPYRDWSGFFLDEVSSTDQNGGELFHATCYSDAYLLTMRAVAWAAGTSNRSAFSSAKGETIMKTLVTYNAAASATVANGRDREGVITGLTVQADGAGGNTLDWNCANDNLLDTLARLAPLAGGDFDVTKTGAAAWSFNWYSGQRGTDRTASVKFSTDLGNMGRPQYTYIRANEKTVAIVKGQGVGVDRTVVVRTGANYNATTNNNEFYVNASSQTTTSAGLNAAGDDVLKTTQAVETIQFDTLQLPNVVYGKDWYLGDKVSVKYKSHTLTPKVIMVTVTASQNSGEIVTPGMAVNV